MSDITTKRGGIERLRQLEATALLATTLAVGLTALLEPATAAVESNPVARVLLAELGWTGAGLVAIGGEALLFAGWRRLAREGYRRPALAAGSGIAAVGVGDVLANVYVLTQVGVPETARVVAYGTPTAVVAVAAAVAFVRPDPRPVLSALRESAGRLRGVEARSVALAAIVVSSMFVGSMALSVGPLPASDTAKAADKNWTGSTASTVNDVIHIPGRGEVVAATNGGGIVVFDESDGSKLRTVATVTQPSDLIYDSSNGQLYVAEYDGVRAYDISTGSEKWAQLTWPNNPMGLALDSGQLYVAGNTGFIAEVNPSDGSKVWQNDNADGSTFPSIAYLDANDRLYVGNNNGNFLEIDPADGTQIAKISTAGNSNVETVRTAGGDIFTGGAGGWQRWDASLSKLQTVSSPTDVQELRVDAKSDSVFIADGPGERWEVYDYNGTLVDSLTTPSTDHATAIALGDDNPRTFYGGYYNGVISATTDRVGGFGVSGSISSDGSGISPATVELRQSGSVVKTTTTASDGSYSFSGVSDGDYTVRASADGYQTSSKSITVAGSAVTADLSLFESGTFTREFQLGPQAEQTYPPSLSRLELYRFDRAIEFPLPGGTEFRAGPGTWTEVETTEFNSQGAAYARLEDGEPYRVDVIATSGARSTRWESLGWLANAPRPDPYGITVGGDDETTPTATSTGTATSPTATPVGVETPTVEYPDLTPPSDPFDLDDDDEYYDDPDGGDGNITAPGGGSGFGPRLAGECLLADGRSGVLIEYWDPDYQTTSLEYNLSAGNNSYAGERTFDTPAGYATWCVSDGLTNNASEGAADLRGSLTRNGTRTNFSDTLEQSALFGGPVGDGGGGEPSIGQRVVGIGLVAGVGYLLVRRFTEFRISTALTGALSRARSLVGGSS